MDVFPSLVRHDRSGKLSDFSTASTNESINLEEFIQMSDWHRFGKMDQMKRSGPNYSSCSRERLENILDVEDNNCALIKREFVEGVFYQALGKKWHRFWKEQQRRLSRPCWFLPVWATPQNEDKKDLIVDSSAAPHFNTHRQWKNPPWAK
jgi:hypothetical protein